MQISSLFDKIDALHFKYGSPDLDAIYGAGCINRPNLCLVFMNPTSHNVSAQKSWKGMKAPWLGTKGVWTFLEKVHLLDREISAAIQKLHPNELTYEFAEKVYRSIANNKVYITNLAKCTQIDARPLSNKIFQKFLPIMFDEITYLRPKAVLTFGNQVSSIMAQESLSVSRCRKRKCEIAFGEQTLPVYPLYYPVGQGRRNQSLTIEDILWIEGTI